MSAEGQWLTALASTIRAIGKHTPASRQWRIGAGATLDGDLGLDSLDRQALAADLEDEFDIAITDAVLGEWKFVADVARTVTEFMAKGDRP